MYQKEIIYMGLHKDGSRVGSAGFIKAEKWDKNSELTMIVKNIPRSIEGRFPVRYCFGAVRSVQETEPGGAESTDQPDYMEWREEDGITLRDGGGVWKKKELEASEQIRVQILLPNGYLVEGENKAAMKPALPKDGTSAAKPTIAGLREPAPVQKKISTAEPMIAEPRESVSVAESAATSPCESASVQSEAAEAEPVVTSTREPVFVRRPVPAAESAVAAAQQPVMPQRQPLMADALAIEGLKEDKWEQILDTYDQIHPYGDGRIYVKIAPKDFIILSSNCQHLVNNSFLLHGFYNYRYVILGKGERSGASPEGDYCLGVPGVFYEREKMVALMFGFEAFECEGGDPKPGDFGYYLRKVEL